MAERQLPKLNTGVRFPSPAPTANRRRQYAHSAFAECVSFFARKSACSKELNYVLINSSLLTINYTHATHSLNTAVTAIHKATPITVGSSIDSAVHFMLCVSLYTVIVEVAHG